MVASGSHIKAIVRNSSSKMDSYGVEVMDTNGKRLFKSLIVGYAKDTDVTFDTQIKFTAQPSSKYAIVFFCKENPANQQRSDMRSFEIKF